MTLVVAEKGGIGNRERQSADHRWSGRTDGFEKQLPQPFWSNCQKIIDKLYFCAIVGRYKNLNERYP